MNFIFADCILKFLTTDNEIDREAFLELSHTEVCDLVGPNKLGIVKKINRIQNEVGPFPVSFQDHILYDCSKNWSGLLPSPFSLKYTRILVHWSFLI